LTQESCAKAKPCLTNSVMYPFLPIRNRASVHPCRRGFIWIFSSLPHPNLSQWARWHPNK
jgi:hypothetical protein